VPTLTDLPVGHSFDPVTFTVTAARARAYRAAVGDEQSLYAALGGAVPPLAVVAFALGALLELVDLPAGSLHASESASFQRVVTEGAEVECRARVAQRSVRAGWVVSVLDSDLLVGGEPAATARATVLSPAS
jgi:acyl dehydratase